ncbi:hypothetical protein Tco_1366771 [Tanacetum coccineum]
MAPTTRRGPNTPVNNTNPNNMTPESIQAMIDQALLRNSTNGDGSHSSHGDNRRNVQTVRPCFYADFMKCQPLNFKGTEGVVGLTRWIEKMESVFNISGCAIENQFVANETEKVDKYISGLPDNIYGNVKSAIPNTLDETIELANDLIDQKLRTYAERLRRCHAVIVCDEKLVQIPYGNETLTFCGNESSNGRESRLTVISCSKAQEYMAKGCQVFLAQISAKKEEDKSEGKQIKDVPIV